MKSKIMVFIIMFLFILSISTLLIFQFITPPSAVAEIYLDDTLIQSVDLSSVTEPEEIPITNGDNRNIVLIEKGRVSMREANCPDKLCVHQGTIKNSVYPIVCLPNKVVIKIVGSSDKDVDTISR